MNTNIRLRYSEVIRLFLGRKDDFFKPLKTLYEQDEYFVYALGHTNAFIPELILDVSDNPKDACDVYDFLRTLSLMVFDVGDLYFDFKIIIRSDSVFLEDLQFTYHSLSDSVDDISTIGNF